MTGQRVLLGMLTVGALAAVVGFAAGLFAGWMARAVEEEVRR